MDQRVLDFLTTSHLKRERLVEVLERLHQQDGVEEHVDIALATGDAVSVLEALDNIELLVEARLLTLQHLPVNSPGMACTPGSRHVPSESAPGQLFINSLGIEFVLIPAGTYTMGSRRARQGRRVTISQPFYLGKYPVTQAQWVAIMGTNPSRFQAEDHPVENVSWEDVQRFIGQLNATLHAREGGARYRLPTEAEWEYAARAGATTVYCFGNDARRLESYAWYAANARGTTHPVGQRKPNAWGVHDMHGNVWEWVQDWYEEYLSRAGAGPARPRHRYAPAPSRRGLAQ